MLVDCCLYHLPSKLLAQIDYSQRFLPIIDTAICTTFLDTSTAFHSPSLNVLLYRRFCSFGHIEMFAVRRIPAPRLAARASSVAFSTTAPAAASKPSTLPALSDIPPNAQEDFNSKQKAFRDRLAEAQRERESSLSPSPTSFTATSPTDPSASVDGQQGLGSLSTAKKGSVSELNKNAAPRKSGPITNLIYGTKEGRELDAQIEASFSQILARGKYVHSITIHDVKPDKFDAYVDLVGQWYPRIANNPDNRVHLVGSWRTEVGDTNTFGMFLQLNNSRA